jgi:hypothetical protein
MANFDRDGEVDLNGKVIAVVDDDAAVHNLT